MKMWMPNAIVFLCQLYFRVCTFFACDIPFVKLPFSRDMRAVYSPGGNCCGTFPLNKVKKWNILLYCLVCNENDYVMERDPGSVQDEN